MFVIYCLNPTEPTVVATADPGSVTGKLPEAASAFLIETEADLKYVPMTTLVALYNRSYPDKPITKFETKSVGAARVFPLLGPDVEQPKQPILIGEPTTSEPIPPTDEDPVKPKVDRTPATPKTAVGDGSPVKGKRLGIGKRMAELLTAGKTTDEVLAVIHAEFPLSRAKASDVSIIRGRMSR